MKDISLRKITKKYNLNLVEETISKERYEVSEFVNIHSIENAKSNNYGLVVSEDDVSKNKSIDIAFLNKISKKASIIIFCGISNSKEITDLKKSFKNYNKPILYTRFTKREVIVLLESYLLKKQKQPERLHATMISIFGEGTLIMGKSGVGKSELALDLIHRKHIFIADDAINAVSIGGTLQGSGEKITRDFIEARGVGIINVRRTFGIQSIVKEHEINVVIELVKLDEVKSSIDRLGNKYKNKTICGIEIPLIQIPISPGKSIASIVEAAIISFKDRKYNDYIAADHLNDFGKKN